MAITTAKSIETIKRHGDPDDQVLLAELLVQEEHLIEIGKALTAVTEQLKNHQIRLDNLSRRVHIIEDGPIFGD